MPIFGALVEVIVPNVTTGHISSSVAEFKKYNGDRWNNVINVMHSDYGAINAGSAVTNTAAINAAIGDAVASGERCIIEIPLGVNLPVTPGGIIGASNLVFTGGGKLSTVQTTAGALITFPAGTTNSGVVGLIFESPNDLIVAVYVKSAPSSMSNGVVVANNRCVECTCVDTNDQTVFWPAMSTHATTGNVTRNMVITGNTGKRTGAVAGSKAFIYAYYLMGGVITDNVASGYPSGIQWWGGDANPANDGAIVNERKCGDLTIGNNRWNNMSIGGTWGSMGRDITVTGDLAEDIGDLCFDCEGGQNVFFDGCVARNGVNGGIGAFWFNRNVRYDVTVETDAVNGWVAEVKNGSGTHDNQSVTINGTFTCNSGVGVFIWEATAHLTMDLHLNNVAFSSIPAFGIQGDTVGRISQRMTTTLGAAFDGVTLGATNGGVVDMDITAISGGVVHPAGSHGIAVKQSAVSTSNIRFNVRGWGTTPVRWEMTTTGIDPGSVPKGYFSGDMLDGAGIDRAELSANGTKSIMFILPGQMTNGTAFASIPAATPVSGHWDVGQRIIHGAPVAGGWAEAVCITAGSPGSWKNCNAIAP